MPSTSGYAPASRTRFERYGFAVLSTLTAMIISVALLDVSESPIYAPLVAAVALTVSFGGLGPAVVCIALAWGGSFWALVSPRGSFDADSADDVVRWGINLAAALAVAVLTYLLRGKRELAVSAAEVAEESAREREALQELATALSAAATTAEVAHSLVTKTPSILGARGGAVGLVEVDELVIVDPRGGALETHPPGSRLPLSTRAPITRASAGSSVVVRSRAEFERDYPDGAAMTPYAHAAIAVPLRVAGAVAGTMSFLFDRPDAMTEGAETIARIAAGLGSQALERASLYERELAARRALDRILRVAPRFHAENPADVAAAICREARATFGADLGTLWRLRDDRLELVCADPVHEAAPPGLVSRLEDFPRLLDALGQLRISFVADLEEEEARGAGLERVRRLGLHSSLRTPIAIGDRAELLLIVSWQTVVPEPDSSTLVVARRLADQAALALEQLDRRLAQAEAARSADETQRLQEVTALLSLAATSTDVSSICVEHALAAVGAEAGFVVLHGSDGLTLDVTASSGLSDAELESWRTRSAAADGPVSKAMARGEPIWLLTAEELAEAVSGHESGDAGWVTIPLKAGSTVRGALHLVFRRPTTLSEGTRRWLQTVVTQCAQALERSRLLDQEQYQRQRAERLQTMTARLSNALSRVDVAEIVLDETGRATGAAGAALAIVVADRQLVRTIAWHGYADDVVAPWLELSLDASAPGNRALRRRSSVFYESLAALRRDFPDVAEAMAAAGHESFLFVPLVAGRDASGVLVLSWAESHVLTAEERSLLETLAGQAAQAIDRAAHFEWERTVAETLQRSVLPASLPQIDGVDLAARYLPGTAELEVGGDWYDAIPLSDGRLGLVVGDVVGKGVAAAANMAQLRNALRAFALDRLKPSSAMARLNRLAEESLEAPFATVVYVVLDPAAGVCRFTSAGHPPPLVAYPDGRVEFLEGGRSLPLGAAPDTRYRHEFVDLPAGTVLLLYTDGLVERRDRPLDDGLELLRRAVAESSREPERLVEHVLDRLLGTGDRGDDVAVLAVRLLPVASQPLRLRLPLELESLGLVRDSLRAWLAGTRLEASAAGDVVLAAWEACVNAVEHGGRGGGTLLAVDGRSTDTVVRVCVEDDGTWREPEPRPERGLGLKLMHALVSSVDVATADTGTRVVLERAVAGEAGDRSEQPDEQQDDQDED